MGVFADTITLYNHKPDDSYQRTVITGVMFSRKTVKAVTADGKVNLATLVEIMVPESAACSRKYIDKRGFKCLEDSTGNWTLDEAGNLDIVVYGAIEQEITQDYRVKHLRSDYDCVTVASVEDRRNRPRLKHIKVVCK